VDDAAEVARQINVLLKGLALRAETVGLTELSKRLLEVAAEAAVEGLKRK
jgi:hypothetical protein